MSHYFSATPRIWTSERAVFCACDCIIFELEGGCLIS